MNCGGKDGYSGLAVYTCVYTQITAHVSRYKDGKRVQKIFLLDPKLQNGNQVREAVELARSMTVSVSIQRGKAATTRYEDDWGWDIDGGELPEVEIMPDDNEEPDWDSWLEENRHDDNVEPEEPMPTEDTAEDQDTSGDDGDYNNDNDDGNQTPAILSPELSKITNYTSMNQAQVNKLETALQEYLNRTIGLKIYDILVSKNVTLDFRIDSKAPNNAYFVKESNNIFFKSENAIDMTNLREELIHAAQYAIYENRMSAEYTNFEFEAKVINDIDVNIDALGGWVGLIGMYDNAEYCLLYDELIRNLSSGTDWNTSFENTYDQLGNIWSEENGGYEGSFDQSISPDLLINIVNDLK